mmetsp:Transcript_7717/g.8920  ORF Transcript_7717/g.8920 Transcript_7717/m.8920 type:complete len:97 (+) Transcript_7717:413-703(+)
MERTEKELLHQSWMLNVSSALLDLFSHLIVPIVSKRYQEIYKYPQYSLNETGFPSIPSAGMRLLCFPTYLIITCATWIEQHYKHRLIGFITDGTIQ